MYIYVYIYMFICIYAYICIYVYIYICIYCASVLDKASGDNPGSVHTQVFLLKPAQNLCSHCTLIIKVLRTK